MLLGKFVWKIKSENDHLPLPCFRPTWPFSRAARSPSSPLPRSAQPPLSAQQPRPAQQPRLRPHQATARAQPLTARAHLSAPPPTSRSPRAATVAHERRRGSAPPCALAASNSSPTPPRAPGCPPALIFALAKHRGRPQPPLPWSPGSAIVELGTSARTASSEPPPSPFPPW